MSAGKLVWGTFLGFIGWLLILAGIYALAIEPLLEVGG